MLLVTLSLTCIVWLSQSLRFVEMIVNRGLTAGIFVYLTMLLLPNFLSVILPIALFTVVLFTYSKLINDRELVVMRAAGVSQLSLAGPGLVLAAAVALIGYANTLYFLPKSYRMFGDLQWDIRYSYSHVLLQEGAFNTVSKGVTVYVRERTSDGQLHGILVHDQRNTKKPFTIMAHRGMLLETPTEARVVMFNGNRQEVDSTTHKLSILYFDRYSFDLSPTRGKRANRYLEARERSLQDLLNLENDETLSPKDFGKYTVEAHKRLLSPIFAVVYTLVGLACLISGSFSRRTQTRRIVLAVTIVVSLQAIALGLENLCARKLEMIPLMYLNPIPAIVISLLVILRAPRRRREAPAGAAEAI
jgi:lipopolysaccharide export system permease protein